jgi:hypothetical protein
VGKLFWNKNLFQICITIQLQGDNRFPDLRISKLFVMFLPIEAPGSVDDSSLRLFVFSPTEFSFSGTQVFSKRKQLFLVWTHLGLPAWCAVMNCKCEFCDASHAANDGWLLSVLPPDIADACKVLPRNATGNFHLLRDVSDDMELLM